MNIERRGYSRDPWRLVTKDGREVCISRSFDHPTLGWIVAQVPVSGSTRAECTARSLKLLETLLSERDVRDEACT